MRSALVHQSGDAAAHPDLFRPMLIHGARAALMHALLPTCRAARGLPPWAPHTFAHDLVAGSSRRLMSRRRQVLVVRDVSGCARTALL